MNDTTDRRLHPIDPFSILMHCPVPGCGGQVALHARRHDDCAVGRCDACGGRAVLRGGVLEPADRHVPGLVGRPGVRR